MSDRGRGQHNPRVSIAKDAVRMPMNVYIPAMDHSCAKHSSDSYAHTGQLPSLPQATRHRI